MQTLTSNGSINEVGWRFQSFRITCCRWLANRSSFAAGTAHRRAFGAMVGNLRVNHERRLVDQICPRWNRLQPWFELVAQEDLRRSMNP